MDNQAQPSALPVMPVPKLHDVEIITKKTYSCARVMGVPPEEFGIARNARTVKEAGYCFHEVTRSESELIQDGYDADQVRALPTYSSVATIESLNRDTVDEGRFQGGGDNGANSANRLIRITENYVRMDLERNGKPRLYRVVTGGEMGDILKREGEDAIEEIDQIPFAAMTPVIVTHRFFGKSIADLVMDIQRIKTALLRGALDNLYLHNNPRVEVSDSHASQDTLDDLLVSRPGGIVRTRQPGGLNWQVVPDITGTVYPALQYFDAVREWRTGVSRQGQGVDPNALQNQVATIANQMESASQAKIRLIARIFAETGIKDMFWLLHGIIRKHGQQPQTVRLRNRWVNVDPRNWVDRDDLTIDVGLGTGSKPQRLAELQLIIAAQEKAIQAGLVSKGNLYNSARQLTALAGYKDTTQYFTPPGEEPKDEASAPIQPPDNPELQKMQMEYQLKEREAQHRQQIEATQAQADIATNNTKTQAELARDERKFQQDSVRSQQEHEMRMAEIRMKMLGTVIGHATKAKPAPAVNEAGEPQQMPEAQEGPDLDELLAKIGPFIAPQPAQEPRRKRRTIKAPSGKTYEINEE